MASRFFPAPQDLDLTPSAPSPDSREGSPDCEEYAALCGLQSPDDLAQGLVHLGNLLRLEPARPKWLEIARRYRALLPSDPEEPFHGQEERFVNTEALKALFLFMDKRRDDALSIIVEILEASSNIRYLNDWVLPWLENDPDLESLPDDLCDALFPQALRRLPELPDAAPKNRRLARRWALLYSRVAKPESGVRVMILTGFWRKAGELEKAEETASSSSSLPDWHRLCALGAVFRAARKWPEAIRAFTHAVELDPEDDSAMLDIIDCWLDTENWKEVIAWCARVLERTPDHAWALPCFYYAQWRLDNRKKWLNQLFQLAWDEHNEHAKTLWGRIYPSEPEPDGFIAQEVRRIREKLQKTPQDRHGIGLVPLRVSCIEAPSSELAFSLEMKALDCDAALKLSVASIPDPDPRKPFGDKPDFLLWRFQGTSPEIAIAPPSPMVVDAIESVALEAKNPECNWDDWARAGALAERFGPMAARDILASMVHPPAAPDGVSSLFWLPRVQEIAALAAAQLDEGWDGSIRKSALLSLLFGPSDWTTAAAISALSFLAMDEPALAYEIDKLYRALERNRPDIGHCCWLEPLYRAWKRLPFLDESEQDELAEKLDGVK